MAEEPMMTKGPHHGIRVIPKTGLPERIMHVKPGTELRFDHNGRVRFTDRDGVPQALAAKDIYAIYEEPSGG